MLFDDENGIMESLESLSLTDERRVELDKSLEIPSSKEMAKPTPRPAKPPSPDMSEANQVHDLKRKYGEMMGEEFFKLDLEKEKKTRTKTNDQKHDPLQPKISLFFLKKN